MALAKTSVKQSILLVEDEESVAESLAFSLEGSGYEVNRVADGKEALHFLEHNHPDLVLLDLMLPKTDGFEVCRAIQKQDDPVPVIMMTAKAGETDRVVGLELGADDYITKPFSTRELEARIKAVLRRKGRTTFEKRESSGDLELDIERRIAKRSGAPVQLSPREWELLTYLMEHKGETISKERLLKEVWGEQFDGDPKTVEIHIHWLRHKLEKDPSAPQYILTFKRKGYCFKS